LVNPDIPRNEWSRHAFADPSFPKALKSTRDVRSDGVKRAWVVALVVVGMVACSDGHDDVVVTYADSSRLGFDAVAEGARNACRSRIDGVRIEIRALKVRRRFDCDDVRSTNGYVTQAALAYDVGDVNDAALRAARYFALQQNVEGAAYEPVDSLTWLFATTKPGSRGTCNRARDPDEVRANLQTVRGRETPEQWTVVEAVMIAVTCPDRLDDLYATVSEVGHGDAARRARARIEKAAKDTGVPLS
jgi:hypothetical protein